MGALFPPASTKKKIPHTRKSTVCHVNERGKHANGSTCNSLGDDLDFFPAKVAQAVFINLSPMQLRHLHCAEYQICHLLITGS